MNQEQIKLLEKELWDSADNLRANSKLTAAEYKDPVLGLILLQTTTSHLCGSSFPDTLESQRTSL